MGSYELTEGRRGSVDVDVLVVDGDVAKVKNRVGPIGRGIVVESIHLMEQGGV